MARPTAPIAIAIGINAALRGVAGRLAVSLRTETVRDDALLVPQCVLAVSGAATHVPDTSFQTLIYDLFINSLDGRQAPLAVRFEKSCVHASRKKLAGALKRLDSKFFNASQI
jgi:hypothetical protein